MSRTVGSGRLQKAAVRKPHHRHPGGGGHPVPFTRQKTRQGQRGAPCHLPATKLDGCLFGALAGPVLPFRWPMGSIQPENRGQRGFVLAGCSTGGSPACVREDPASSLGLGTADSASTVVLGAWAVSHVHGLVAVSTLGTRRGLGLRPSARGLVVPGGSAPGKARNCFLPGSGQGQGRGGSFSVPSVTHSSPAQFPSPLTLPGGSCFVLGLSWTTVPHSSQAPHTAPGALLGCHRGEA